MNHFENKILAEVRMAIRKVVQDTISNDLEWVELEYDDFHENPSKLLEVLNLPRNPKRKIDEPLPADTTVRYVITTPELGALLGDGTNECVFGEGLYFRKHGFIDFEYEIFSELLLPTGVFYVVEDSHITYTDHGTKVIKKAKINF
jgi:hypothetical protein